MDTLNNFAPCKKSPKNIEILPASVRVYQGSYRTTVLATCVESELCRFVYLRKVLALINCSQPSYSDL